MSLTMFSLYHFICLDIYSMLFIQNIVILHHARITPYQYVHVYLFIQPPLLPHNNAQKSCLNEAECQSFVLC